MLRKRSTALTLISTLEVAAALSGCARQRLFDYQADDPVAEAACALVDSGDYRVLAIRWRDSLIVPIDSSLPRKPVNLERPPGGFYVFLKPERVRGNPDRPSQAQMSFMERYNTVIFTLLQAGSDE